MDDKTLYQFEADDIKKLRTVIRLTDANQFKKLLTDAISPDLNDPNKKMLLSLIDKVDQHINRLNIEKAEYAEPPIVKDGVMTVKFSVNPIEE